MVNKMLKMLMNDLVTLVKASGQRFENLPAAVQAGKIFTQDPTVPIEDGDTFERKIPSGIASTGREPRGSALARPRFCTRDGDVNIRVPSRTACQAAQDRAFTLGSPKLIRDTLPRCTDPSIPNAARILLSAQAATVAKLDSALHQFLTTTAADA